MALLVAATTANAVTLRVNCGGHTGLTSIGAALKALQYSESRGPATINISGACKENLLIQSFDRLTLNGLPGASVTDASGGTSDVIDVADSQSVSINNLTVSGSSVDSGGVGISCYQGSLCRLNNDTVQGATNGVTVGALSRAFVTGGTLQHNGIGLFVVNNAGAWVFGTVIQGNGGGVELRAQGFLTTDAQIADNTASGLFATHNSTFNCVECSVTGNAILGVILRRDSSARFAGGYVITGNTGPGVLLSEESSAFFPGAGNVTGNSGGLDVYCGASSTTAKFATTNIGGGTTNCVEPVEP